VHGLTITEALREPREDSLGLEIEDRLEVGTEDVGLSLGIVVDVPGHKLLIDRQISRGGRRLDPESRYKILSSDLADEAHAQLDEGESITLRLGQVGKLMAKHPGRLTW
jgi:hypothetical protein